MPRESLGVKQVGSSKRAVVKIPLDVLVLVPRPKGKRSGFSVILVLARGTTDAKARSNKRVDIQ